ncbi:MAG: ABC transporter permease [Clostridium sp.]
MYSKIAVKNVKKSFKDYSIYFLTLTLAVSIFYSFNSIESQRAILEISKVGQSYTHTLLSVISYMSVFVSVILGSLILYANNFLIKKRNRELGIYMTLGMGKSKISRILITETVVVGVASLISGLILGVLASQGLTILISKLFEVSMDEYRFIFSSVALGKTFIYFGIIFLLVMIFNVFVISKYKIIDLLTVGRKTQEIKSRGYLVYIVMFAACLTCLLIAYKFAIDTKLDYGDTRFLIAIILGVIGTLLFFVSLGGFMINTLKKSKKIYFKGLNIFTIKQINSKIKTNFISMTVICLMLFITISVLSTGFSFKHALETNIEEYTEYDFSGYIFPGADDKIQNINQALDAVGFKIGSGEKHAEYILYHTNTLISDVLKGVTSELNSPIKLMGITEYNSLRRLQGKEEINLKGNEAVITSNFEMIMPSLKDYMKSHNTIKIDGVNYKIENKEPIEENLQTSYMKDNFLTIIVNDNKLNGLQVYSSVINVNFNKSSYDKSEGVYNQLIEGFRNGKFNTEYGGFVLGSTRDRIIDDNKGTTTVILFVGIYLGLIFLISSMAVLSLQQLSEANDSMDRYTSLKRLGVSDSSINRSILVQTLVYFTVPIALAIIHSIVAIKVVTDFLSIYNKPDIGGSSLLTMGIFLVVYLGYFVATYTGYKNIVK